MESYKDENYLIPQTKPITLNMDEIPVLIYE
jgi:hypothetical protein